MCASASRRPRDARARCATALARECVLSVLRRLERGTVLPRASLSSSPLEMAVTLCALAAFMLAARCCHEGAAEAADREGGAGAGRGLDLRAGRLGRAGACVAALLGLEGRRVAPALPPAPPPLSPTVSLRGSRLGCAALLGRTGTGGGARRELRAARAALSSETRPEEVEEDVECVCEDDRAEERGDVRLDAGLGGMWLRPTPAPAPPP